MAPQQKAAALLVASLASAPAGAASREWVLARSPGFVVVSDAGEDRARQVVHQFEQVRGLFAQVLQARVEPGRLVVIFAVRDEDGLRELLPGYWTTRGGRRPAGVFVAGRDKHLVALRLDVSDEHPYHVIYHEYTHLLTRLNVRWLPLWLSEGLAEFYGTADVDDQEVRWGRVFPPHVLYLRRGSPLKLTELMSADHGSSAYTRADSTPAFYAQSAILTHYLLIGAPERRGQVQQFLKLLESGVDEPEARQQAFGDLGKLQTEITNYVRRPTFPGIKTQARIDRQAIAVAALTPAQADALRGDFLARTGTRGQGRALLEGSLAQDASLSWAHEGLGTLSDASGRPTEALAHFVEAFRAAPENYVALYRAGRISDPSAPLERDAARREQLLRRAIHANPSFAPALADLAELIAGRADRASEAVALAQKACALDPAAAASRVALWNVLRRTGRAEEAARVEEDLLRVARRDRETLFRLVDRLEEQDRAQDAEALLRKARAGSPNSVMVAQLITEFLQRHGRGGEAEAILRETLASDPQSLLLMNGLAYTLADRPGKAQEALDLIDKVLKKGPKQTAYLDTRGWALFRLGRLPEAESVLRSAAASADSGEIMDHLGDVLRARGKAAEALTQYERALETSDLTEMRRTDVEKKAETLRASVTPASPAPVPSASPRP